MDNIKIDRINALAPKQKSVGLTEEEKVEQAKLEGNIGCGKRQPACTSEQYRY